jgi:CheY-like chemotaxis protein
VFYINFIHTKYANILLNQTFPKSNILIIDLRTHALEGEKDKCLSLGMNDFIHNPFNQEELYEKIKKKQPIYKNKFIPN